MAIKKNLIGNYRFDGTKECKVNKLPTDSKQDKVDKEEIIAQFEKNLVLLDEMQNTFYSAKKEGIVIVLQAMDAAGKDSLIRHVTASMNPQGVSVCCLKRPSTEEINHDYLWRINKALPRRGEITLFNRSYYEDIITADVHDLMKTYPMAERVIGGDEKDFIEKRIKQVKNYETYLYENSYRVVKIFLHVSKDEQKKRLLERIDRPEKNWKFEAADLEERALFDTYMEKFDHVITETATKDSPWYALPADDKWYTRYLFTEILIDIFKQIGSEYPDLPEAEKAKLADCKARLLAEDGPAAEPKQAEPKKAKKPVEEKKPKAARKPAEEKKSKAAKKSAKAE